MKKDYPEELVEFLVQRHGGEAQILKEFAEEKIADLAKEEGTLGDLLEAADEQGFRQVLERVKLTTLAEIINPTPKTAGLGLTRDGQPRIRIRLSPAERAELHERILAFLGDNPWSLNAEIAQAVDLDTKRLGAQLRELKNDGKLKSFGSRVKMRYARAEEKSKPPVD